MVRLEKLWYWLDLKYRIKFVSGDGDIYMFDSGGRIEWSK